MLRLFIRNTHIVLSLNLIATSVDVVIANLDVPTRLVREMVVGPSGQLGLHAMQHVVEDLGIVVELALTLLLKVMVNHVKVRLENSRIVE